MSTAERVSLRGQSTTNKTAPVIIRPSLLGDKRGVVAKGILEKVEKNKFDESKNDYFLRDGETLYIVNETALLKEQLNQPGLIGLWIEVEYNGKKAGKNKKPYHDFSCFATKN